MKTITATELASHLADSTSQVIDVRESNEYRLEYLPGTTHIPLSDFDAHIGKLDRQKRTS